VTLSVGWKTEEILFRFWGGSDISVFRSAASTTLGLVQWEYGVLFRRSGCRAWSYTRTAIYNGNQECMERGFHSQTNLKDKGIGYLLTWSTKQSSKRSRHRDKVEVRHQPQAVSAFTWGKNYQFFGVVTNRHGNSSEVIMFIIIIIYIIISSLPILRFLPLHGSWSLQLFLRRPTFLLPVGVYWYTNLEMRVSFIANKCRVLLLPQSTVTLLVYIVTLLLSYLSYGHITCIMQLTSAFHPRRLSSSPILLF
jgi:hypothetical protein